MSDTILKFWPTKEASLDKTQAIVKELMVREILGEETLFWDKPAYKFANKAVNLFAPSYEVDSPYIQQLAIMIKEEDYGVVIGEEDFEYIDRKNVVTVNGGDGELTRSEDFCEILFDITDDRYSTDFELL